MFGIGMPELMVILVVALIIIGPKKLPDLAKSLGKALGDFKRATSDLKDSIEMETGLDETRDNLNTIKDDLEKTVSLDSETPASTPSTARKDAVPKATPPEAPMDKVKASFGELNTPADSDDPDLAEDDDDMGEDYISSDNDDAKDEDTHPEDKATS